MTAHIDIDDDTDCEGRLDLTRVTGAECVVTCARCGEEFRYARQHLVTV